MNKPPLGSNKPRSGGARGVALDLLAGVLDQGRTLDGLIGGHAGLAALSYRDRAFARLLTAAVLRRKGQIDALIDAMLERPLPAKPPALRHLLRLGTAQIVFLATPPHAAVGETVALTKRLRLAGFAALVNAVLRRMTREGAALAAGQDAARLNLPDWLWESWVAAYGPEAGRAAAEAHLEPPPLDLTLFKPHEDWAERLGAEPLPTGGLRLAKPGGPVEDLPGYGEGAWQPQDAAAGLPARLLLNALDGDVNRHIADLCAAPGGKTAQLAAAGARVTSVDRASHRLGRLRGNLARLGFDAEIIEADVLDWQPPEQFDAVLLDAPCSATGTLRRRPDVAWRKTPKLAVHRTALQDRLLARAADLVKPGGVLVYAVCSLQPEEGVERIAALLAARLDLARQPVTAAEIGDPAFLGGGGDLLTLPGRWAERGGIDGFYVTRLIKES